MRKLRNMFQTKEQDKTSEKDINSRKISDLHDKESEVMVIKRLTVVGEKCMNTVRISAKRKHKKVPNRNHTSEEYNN